MDFQEVPLYDVFFKEFIYIIMQKIIVNYKMSKNYAPVPPAASLRIGYLY